MARTSGQLRVLGCKRYWFPEESGRKRGLRRLDRAAEKVRPADGADADRDSLGQPLPQLSIMRGARHERPDQEARVQVDHRPRASLLPDAARRSVRTRALHARAFAGDRASALCRFSSASTASPARPISRSAVDRIARRKASDSETFQTRAISSRALTVGTSSG